MSEDKLIVAVDSQKVNMVQMCGFKYDLTFNRDLIPVHKQEFFERGDLIHKMLQTYYSMRKYMERWPAEFNQTKIRKICERVGEYHAVKMSIQIEDVDNTFRTFKDYIEYYWGEAFKTLFVEQIGCRVLHEDNIPIIHGGESYPGLVILYETKIDWGIEMSNCPLMPVDHKSSYKRGNTIAISNQFMGYCWMLGVYNLMVNKVGFQKTVKPAEKFSRPILSYPPSVINNWKANSIWWVKEGLRYEREGYWPQNFTSCDKYAGCLFTQVCESPTETRNNKIAQLFDIAEEPWDPGRRL